jgi:hypothetical protein
MACGLSRGGPPGDDARMSERLETLRILGRYRRMVLLGKARLPFEQARRLVGPDCAYHLYFRHAAAPVAKRRRLRASR